MAEQQRPPIERPFRGLTSVHRWYESWGGQGIDLQHSVLNSAVNVDPDNNPPCWEYSNLPQSGLLFRREPITLETGFKGADKYGDYLERYLIRHFGEDHYFFTIEVSVETSYITHNHNSVWCEFSGQHQCVT